MMRPLRGAVLACASVLFLAPLSYAAPVALDPPTLDSNIESTATIHLDITAGATGAPNGFVVEWLTRAKYDALGGWPADPADPVINSAIFLGYPSLNTVDGTYSFLLGAGQTAKIEIGDIFDETGVLSDDRGEMSQGTDYVFRVKANGDQGDPGGSFLPGSGYSGTLTAHTKPLPVGNACIFTQGYWKNHPSAWPVTSLKLGSIIYTQAQLLLIFNEPAAGNGLISLAHQLIAAKLNLLSGAIPTPLITGAISTADALIGSKVVPPIGAGYLAPGVTSHLTDDLEEFNSMENDPTLCQHSTDAKSRTWGELKAIYR
jgi:hypothetical protein